MRAKTLFSLIRVELYQLFTSLVSSRTRKTKASWLVLLSFALPIGLCLYLTGIYTFALVESLPLEYRYLILVMGAFMATMIVFVLTFYHASAHLFQFKDYDLLMSLPIPSFAILISKLLAFYLYNYFFTLFLMLSPIFGYVSMGSVSPLFYLYALLGSFALPILPLIVSAIIAFVITFVASRFKRRNQMTTLVSFAFMLGVMMVSMRMNEMIGIMATQVNEIMPMLAKYYPPIYYYVMALDQINVLQLLILLGLALILGLVFVGLFARGFRWLNSAIRMSKTSKAKRYDEKKLASSSVLRALIQKEFSRYLNSHSYILNTLVGPVLAVIGTVFMLIKSPAQIEQMLAIPGFADFTFLVLIASMCFMCVASCTAASSISMEGKNLWILKSLPVAQEQIFLAKIGLNLLVLVPILGALALILAIRFQFAIIQVILLVAMVCVASLFVALVGLITNLHFPKLDWVSEVSVVKQSMSVLVSMAIGAAVFGGMAYAYIKFALDVPQEIGIGFYLLVLVGLCVMLWRYLITKGKRLFDVL